MAKIGSENEICKIVIRLHITNILKKKDTYMKILLKVIALLFRINQFDMCVVNKLEDNKAFKSISVTYTSS